MFWWFLEKNDFKEIGEPLKIFQIRFLQKEQINVDSSRNDYLQYLFVAPFF